MGCLFQGGTYLIFPLWTDMIIFFNTSAACKQHTKAEFTTYKADPKV